MKQPNISIQICNQSPICHYTQEQNATFSTKLITFIYRIHHISINAFHEKVPDNGKDRGKKGKEAVNQVKLTVCFAQKYRIVSAKVPYDYSKTSL